MIGVQDAQDNTCVGNQHGNINQVQETIQYIPFKGKLLIAAFAIFTSSRTYTLSAPTETTSQEWIKTLLQASTLSAHKCEEELGLEPTLSKRPNRSPPSVPRIDTSVPSSHSMPSAVPFTGISPTSGRRASLEMHRVQSFESTGGYFSGTELSPSPLDAGVLPPTPGPSAIMEPMTPGIEFDRQSYETDELEGLAEDRVVAQGYLLCLKNVSGVRQWKRRWVVLRGRSLTLYKNFEVSQSAENEPNDRNTSRYE